MDQIWDCLRNNKPQLEDTGSSSSSSDPEPEPSLPDTAELEPYIKNVIVGGTKEAPSSNPPVLRRGVINHILLYRGSFNPPHIGHKALLAHAFLRSYFDNLVAAFIIPMGVTDLRLKMEKASEPHETAAMILSWTQRGELWQDDTILQWAWIYTYSHQFKRLRKALLSLDSKDRFDLDFVLLAGDETVPGFIAECVNSGDPLPNIVFSDPMRIVDVLEEDGTVRAIPGFGK